MEQRLEKLEVAVERLDRDVREIRDETRAIHVTLATVVAKLDQLGNLKTHVWLGVLTVVATIFGLLFTVQQMTVSTFRAAADTMQPPSAAQPPIVITIPPPAAPPASTPQK